MGETRETARRLHERAEREGIAIPNTPAHGREAAPAPGSARRHGAARLLSALAVLLGAWLAAACVIDGGRDDVLVAAAASLTDVLLEVAGSYEDEPGATVYFTFGGSSALARQIELGAPADVVVFAGPGPVDRLEDRGLLAPGTRVDVLTNRLVVIGPRGSGPLDELADLLATGGRIAIADPSLAPAGRYAREALEAAGLWDRLESRVVPSLDVRAAAGAVGTGNAAFGIVYATDAAAAARVSVLLAVPEGLHEPIVYPGAVVARSDDTGRAERFIEYLRGETARRVFERHGFTPAGP